MLTATSSLARRIEQAESALIAEMGRSASRRLGSDQVIVSSIGGGAAVMPSPGSPLSKVSGLGFEPLDETALDAVEAEFARFQTPVRVELSSLGDPDIGKLLSSRGYALSGFENVLGLSLGSAAALPPAPASAVATIERTAPQDVPAWIEVITTGFMHPDTFDGPSTAEPIDRALIEPVFQDIALLEGYSQYLARRDGEPAGAASMRIHDGVAQLCGAATLPGHRRLGIQTALLRERLVHAARAGCDVAIVTTEPGSKSQENVQRQGFELLYVRAIMIKT
jgi:ribosomal protein S18 acetylase RimI-like enzyme